MFETYSYKETAFTVYEELDYFILVVNDETYLLDSMADIREFIQYSFVLIVYLSDVLFQII